jgi:hypothetical protein
LKVVSEAWLENSEEETQAEEIVTSLRQVAVLVAQAKRSLGAIRSISVTRVNFATNCSTAKSPGQW